MPLHDKHVCPHCGKQLDPHPYLMAHTPEGAPKWVGVLGKYTLAVLILAGVFSMLGIRL